MPMRITITVILCITLVVSSCGLSVRQKEAIDMFGEATAVVGAFCGEELVFIKQNVAEMNLYFAALDTAYTSRGIDTLGAFASAKNTEARIAAGKALRSYGEMLSELATGDQEKEIHDAADTFIRNASAALGAELGDDRHNAAATLLQTLASKLAEWKRTDAIESIVPRARTVVDRLAEMLAVDFSLDGGDWRSRGFLFSYRDTAYRLRNEAQQVTEFGGAYPIPHRYIAVQAYHHAASAIARAALVEERCAPALEELLKANGELVHVIEDKDYSIADIQKYHRQARELVGTIETLRVQD